MKSKAEAMPKNHNHERLTARPYQGIDDFMRVRLFLMETYRLNQTFHNWDIRWWEGQRFWGDLSERLEWETHVHMWENEQGGLVGVAHPEGKPGNVWLQIHPDYRHLEEEMLDWAESHLVAPNDEGRLRLWLQVFDYDSLRQEMLTRRGYEKTDDYGYLRWQSLDKPIPEVTVPAGYTVRSMRPGDQSDIVRWTETEKLVFPHANSKLEITARFQIAPSYRHDLQLVAEAENGVLAAFAGLTIDPMNATAVFEPVGTHPDYRQKGLAKAVMCEGLRRLKSLGVTRVYVGTGDMIPANKLYESVGFADYHMNHIWWKAF